MIEIIQDKDNKILAYIEWNLLDSQGHFDNTGKYVWINDVYIHPSLRGNGTLKTLSRMIRKRCPQAIEFYFQREKYNSRYRQYEIDRYLKNE